MARVLHLLASGKIGGIENLMEEYGQYSIHDNTFLFLWSGGVIAKEMVAKDLNIEVWNITKKDYLSVPFRIRDYVKNNDINAIVIHHASPLLHLSNILITKTCKNVRTYVYLHSSAYDAFEINKGKCNLKYLIKKYSFESADHVIAISNYVKQTLVEVANIPSEKIEVIYNGIDCNKYHYAKNKNQTLEIICVGRLIKEKGIDNIIRCLSKIPTEVDLHLTVVGDGPEKDNLIMLAKEQNLERLTTFLGERRDIPELLSKSDIFLYLPNCQEGFGLTVVEAMASGLICIVNSNGGLPEIIQNNINGYRIEFDDQAQNIIIKIWKEMHIDHQLSLVNQEIKEKAIEDVNNKFSIEIYTNKLDILLRD